MKIEETEDGKAVKWYGGSFRRNEAVEISKEVLDEILEKRLTGYSFENFLDYYRLQKKYTIEVLDPRELVGRDLRGTTLRVWHSNWDDSEWISSSYIRAIVENGNDLVIQWEQPLQELSDALNWNTDDDEAWGFRVEAAEKAVRDAGIYEDEIRLDGYSLASLYQVELLTPRERTKES